MQWETHATPKKRKKSQILLLHDVVVDLFQNLFVGILLIKAVDEMLYGLIKLLALFVIEDRGIANVGNGTVMILSSIAVDESLQRFFECRLLLVLDDEKNPDVVISNQFLRFAFERGPVSLPHSWSSESMLNFYGVYQQGSLGGRLFTLHDEHVFTLKGESPN